MKKIFMFPGQGSQKTGMGDELFNSFPEITDACEDILWKERGFSLREICSSSEKVELLNRTDFTQPLLYLVNALSYQTRIAAGERGDIFVGHSLGEYNALHAAGGFDLLTGFRLVMKRGELMSRAKEGKMAALLGLEDAVVEEIISRHHSPDKPVEVANYNSPGQVIVSGDTSALEPLENVFKEAGAKKVIWLPVSGAFHSSLMQPAADEFKEYLKGVALSPLKSPVYANTTALPYPSDPETIKEYLSRQICSPVRWTEEVRNIRKDHPESEFIEVGPGQVLTGLVKRIL